MALSDGSRICDSNRSANAAIDADYTMSAKSNQLIYAAGVRPEGAEVLESQRLYWRRVGGTFVNITTTGELKYGATVLVNAALLTNANKRTTQTATSVEEGLEVETTAGAQGYDGANREVFAGESTEGQWAIDFSAALDNQQYEFRVRYFDNDAKADIDVVYAAKVTTPAVGAASTLFKQHPMVPLLGR